MWIDDPNPIFRSGLARCLYGGRFVLVGESAGFEPDLGGDVDVVVFDLGRPGVGFPRSPESRLLGVVTAGGADDALAGHCTVLVRAELTPESFVACLRSLLPESPSPPPRRPWRIRPPWRARRRRLRSGPVRQATDPQSRQWSGPSRKE